MNSATSHDSNAASGPSRRDLLGLALGLAASGLLARGAHAQDLDLAADTGLGFGPAQPFGPETVKAIARDLATRPFQPLPEIADEWRGLSYEQMKEIWFDGKHALFRDHGAPEQPSAVQAEFFPAGLYQHQKIEIHAVEDGQSRPVIFDLALFDTTDRFPQLAAEGTGFSGLRLTGEIEEKGTFQEYAVFQGASYFRAVAKGQQYGLSARGLALDTIRAGAQEEFPVFRSFWIEKALPDAETVVLHALLDSASTTGAYRFAITKGEATVMDVEATLFPRVALEGAGIAPLTSMFLFNGLNRLHWDDFREAVHDSDGLLMATGSGELLWRPLNNPPHVEASWFGDSNPRGFGLMQRARDAGSYNDLAAHYERRPSLWIEPLGDWGAGAVVLAEIPADKEIYDNIVAFWQPAEALQPGAEHAFSYRMHWAAGAPPVDGALARVISTRSGHRIFEEGRLFTIDFEAHPALGEDAGALEPVVTLSEGELRGAQVFANPATGGMRVDLTVILPEDRMTEMRVELRRGNSAVGETWLYRWMPR